MSKKFYCGICKDKYNRTRKDTRDHLRKVHWIKGGSNVMAQVATGKKSRSRLTTNTDSEEWI